MQVKCGLLAIIFLVLLQAVGHAADLMLPVPTIDPAYAQLYQLDKFGVLPSGPEKLLDAKNQRALTRYDIAFLLVEPLERCTALVEVQDTTTVLTEQRRRADIIYDTVSKLSTADFDRLLSAMTQLVQEFSGDLDQLSPAVSHRATAALRKLANVNYRPWVRAKTVPGSLSPTVHISVNPRAPVDSLRDPFIFLATPSGSHTPNMIPMQAPGGSEGGSAPFVGSYPVSSLEAAVDVAFGRFRLYGSLATLPAVDPAESLLNADGSGRAKLGMEIGVAHLRDFDITGIFEFHVARSGDPANPDTNTAALGGIGISW